MVNPDNTDLRDCNVDGSQVITGMKEGYWTCQRRSALVSQLFKDCVVVLVLMLNFKLP